MVFLKEFVTNIIMKNIVIIILTGLLICLILSYLFSRKNVEQFATNTLNTDPKDYDESEKIIKEVAELTKVINKVEETQKPDTSSNNLEAVLSTEKQETSKRLAQLTNKITQSEDMSKYVLKSTIKPSIDMSKYILKSKIKALSNSPNMSKYMLKSKIKSCPKGPELSDYILKTKIEACSKPKDMSKYVLKSTIKPSPKLPDMSKYVLKSSVEKMLKKASKSKSKSKPKPEPTPKPKPKPKPKPTRKPKPKPEPKCTTYIPRMPINLTRNQPPPKKCKIYKTVIKQGDLYGAY